MKKLLNALKYLILLAVGVLLFWLAYNKQDFSVILREASNIHIQYILLAFIISAPVAYYIMYKWLQNYTYRIQVSAYIFLLAIAGSIIIAWITVGQRAIKAAMANPVKSLRTE